MRNVITLRDVPMKFSEIVQPFWGGSQKRNLESRNIQGKREVGIKKKSGMPFL